MVHNLRVNLPSLTQGAFSKLPCLSYWEGTAKGEVLRRLHAVVEAAEGATSVHQPSLSSTLRPMLLILHHCFSALVLVVIECWFPGIHLGTVSQYRS